MLSPLAHNLIIKHFDAIDRATMSKLLYKRPRDEEEITKSLIDALDHECQAQEGISYMVDQLNADLRAAGEPTFVQLEIETHSYSKKWEHYVSQSDLGLIIEYKNYYERTNSRSWAWLLQAKKLFPLKGTVRDYGARSKFESYDPDQHDRIKELLKFVDIDFFKYLLYCPRPELLPDDVRMELSYLRGKSLNRKIFDYLYGQELRDDLRNGSPTLASGMFVSDLNSFPQNLGALHEGILESYIPFSWFILNHLVVSSHNHYEDDELLNGNMNNEIARKIVSGDPSVVNEILKEFDVTQRPRKILPAATITISVSQGIERG